MIYSDRHKWSIQSATNSATGSAIDARACRGFYGYLYATGNSAVMTIQASHLSPSEGAVWLPVVTVTGLNNTGLSAVSLNYYPYLRGQVSGYAGTTASIFIAPGVQ